MTDASPHTPAPANKGSTRGIQRCPACGQKLVTPAPFSCPLCEYIFGDDSITGNDVTPYAKAYARHWPGLWRMCEWIWYAGAVRMKHVALIRPSAASKHFWLTTVIALTLFAGLFQATKFSFHTTQHLSTSHATNHAGPTGQGWLLLAAAPRQSHPASTLQTRLELWCNPAVLITLTVIGSVTAFLLCGLITKLGRTLASMVHGRTRQTEGRMGAAFHYSTAWSIPIDLGLLVASVGPVALASQVGHWSWLLPVGGFDLAGGVTATFGAAMWWFWFVRLGMTAPSTVRSQVLLYLSVGLPILVLGAIALWWFGLGHLFRLFIRAANLQF